MILCFLTCRDNEEAKKIADTLLTEKLIVCAKMYPVSSMFLWKGEKDSSEEVMLMMETLEEKFQSIENVVTQIHSYETPALFSIPVNHMTKGVEKWLNEELS